MKITLLKNRRVDSELSISLSTGIKDFNINEIKKIADGSLKDVKEIKDNFAETEHLLFIINYNDSIDFSDFANEKYLSERVIRFDCDNYYFEGRIYCIQHNIITFSLRRVRINANSDIFSEFSEAETAQEETLQREPVKVFECKGLVFKSHVSQYANTKGYCVHRESFRIEYKESCKCAKCTTQLDDFYSQISSGNFPTYTRPLIPLNLFKLVYADSNLEFVPYEKSKKTPVE